MDCCAAGIRDAMTTGVCNVDNLTGECRSNYFSCCSCCNIGIELKTQGRAFQCPQASRAADCSDVLQGCCTDDFGEQIPS